MKKEIRKAKGQKKKVQKKTFSAKEIKASEATAKAATDASDAQTEGGQCHVTCVRPRSEAAAVLGTSDRGRTAPRHMRLPHITCVRPRSEAVAWGTSDRGRTVVARVRSVPCHL